MRTLWLLGVLSVFITCHIYVKYGKLKTYQLTLNFLSTMVNQGGFRRRLIYFRISLKTFIFPILKISSDKNCVYRNLHHQCFERQYVAQFSREIFWYTLLSRSFSHAYLLYPNSKSKLGMQESSIF